MTSSGTSVFELIAAIFTLSFIVLTFFVWRFLRSLDKTRARMHDLADGLQERRLPILAELRDGNPPYKIRGQGAPSEGETLSTTLEAPCYTPSHSS